MSELRKRGYLGEGGLSNREYMQNLDSSQENLFRKIVLVAENDGAAYRKRDAKMAFNRAKKEYMRNHMSDLAEDFKQIAGVVEKYLRDRWAREGREKKRYQI